MSGTTKQSERPGPTRPARTEAARARNPLWKRLAPVAVFFAIAVAVVGWHMSKYPYLSPIDENAHFDYIRILPDIPGPGDHLSQDSLRMTACRGYAPDLFDQGLATYPWPRCHSRHFEPGVFPGGGFSTAGSTAPLYYLVEAALARPVAYLTDIPLLVLARAVNVLWLTGFMTVTYLVGRRLRAPRKAAAAAAVLLATSSDVVTSASTLGPDTATAVVGGLVMLAALNYDGGRRTTLLLIGAVALAGITKLTAFTAVGVGVIFLLVRAVRRARAGARREAVAAAGTSALMAVLFATLSAAWFLRPGQDGSSSPAERLPMHEVIPWWDGRSYMFFNFLPPNYGNFNASFLEGIVNGRIETVMAGLMMFSLLLGVVALRAAPRASAFAWGVAAMAMLGPVLLTLLNYYAYGTFFALPQRYGYGLLAGMGGLVAWAFRSPPASRAMVVIAGASLVSVFV